jgi:hypothetical protein
MVSGDDIAQVEHTTKQIIDEKEYIYKDLLKGPNGCEKDIETGKLGLPWQFYDAKKPNIGLPILYDYNLFTTPGQELPDPYNSGYKNKMANTALNHEKPTFLPGVQFENTNGRGPGKDVGGRWCGDSTPEKLWKYDPKKIERSYPNPPISPEGDYILCIQDLFPLRNHSGWVFDRFEPVIGVY